MLFFIIIIVFIVYLLLCYFADSVTLGNVKQKIKFTIRDKQRQMCAQVKAHVFTSSPLACMHPRLAVS